MCILQSLLLIKSPLTVGAYIKLMKLKINNLLLEHLDILSHNFKIGATKRK